MPKAKKILDRMGAVGATKKITQAMKMVSVAKAVKMKERAGKEMPYIDAHQALFQEMARSYKGGVVCEGCTVRPLKRALIICITTDKGLCGAFNQHVLNNVVALYNAYQQDGVAVEVLPIGKKGFEGLSRHEGMRCRDDYVTIRYEEALAETGRIAGFAYDAFVQGDYDKVMLVYQPSKVAAKDKVVVTQLLPVAMPSVPLEEALEEDGYGYEPTKEAIMAHMVGEVVRGQLHKAWLLAGIAEQTVRRLVTSQATDNAEKLIKDLQIDYNRARQSAITQSLSEIMGGVNAKA